MAHELSMCHSCSVREDEQGGTGALVRQKGQEAQGHTEGTVPPYLSKKSRVDLVTVSRLILRSLDSSTVARPGDQARKPRSDLRSSPGQRGAQPGTAVTARAKQGVEFKCSSC